MIRLKTTILASIFSLVMSGVMVTANASGTHATGQGHEESKTPNDGGMGGMMKGLREIHRSHEHGHDFEAMEKMSPEQVVRVMKLMGDVGIALPPMSPERGRKLFAQKGCVVCHVVNGVGGEDGPTLNAKDMPSPMNAFEFAARMWRGAAAMTAMQQEELGGVINLTGQELADLVAFAHDENEQKKLTLNQVPKQFRDKIGE